MTHLSGGTLTNRHRPARRLWAAAVSVFVTSTAVLVLTGAPAHADVLVNCGTKHIGNVINGRHASAELGYTGSRYGEVRARTLPAGDGPWERFQICEYVASAGYVYYTILSLANGLYVSMEYGYTGTLHWILRARSSTVGPWERFYLEFGFNELSCVQSMQNYYYVRVDTTVGGVDQFVLRADDESCNDTFTFADA